MLYLFPVANNSEQPRTQAERTALAESSTTTAVYLTSLNGNSWPTPDQIALKLMAARTPLSARNQTSNWRSYKN